jgi:hypothetical protein
MGVTGANLANKTQATNFTSLATASISPTANKLLIAHIATRATPASPAQPTLSGAGLTWAFLDTFLVGGRRQTLFTAFGPAPSAGAVTADFAGNTQTTGTLQIDQFTGARFSYGNNGIDCVQNITHNNGSAITTLTVTLPDFHNTNNATYGAFCHSAGGTPTAGSGFSFIANSGSVGGFINATTPFQAANDTTIDVSYSGGTTNIQAIGMEIIAATPPATPLILM